MSTWQKIPQCSLMIFRLKNPNSKYKINDIKVHALFNIHRKTVYLSLDADEAVLGLAYQAG